MEALVSLRTASPLQASPASISHPASTTAGSYGRQRQPSSLHASWGSESGRGDGSLATRAFRLDQPSAISVSHMPERVEWDIQDNGMKELAIIQKEAERLEALFNQRHQTGPPGLDLDTSLDSSRVGAQSADAVARSKLRRAANPSSEAIIRAEVKMAQKLRKEGSHLSAKRYILGTRNPTPLP